MFDYGARLYNASIGRWFVVDPLANHGLQIDKSPYAYGWNNPIKYSDPSGLCPNGCSENEQSGEPYKDGARVITFVKVVKEKVYLVSIYDKGQLDNLTKDQIIELLKKAGLL